ncbi:MAG: S1 RNA-binding domain-containing protein [Candidatus Moranbacteria bacterium]|nr:S1 RNA-binding domain-containing protein [Candidatus Moranbacteria bacterium]
MSDILDNLAKEVDKISEEENVSVDKVDKKEETEKPTEEKEEDQTVMGQLLSSQKLRLLQVGEVIEGTVIEIAPNAVYLDIEPYGTGIVYGKEIKDGLGREKLQPGDPVSATITDLENDNGYIELSIREASREKAWDDIESKRDTQDVLKTKVLSANKGGLLVEINGINGFLPVSQLSNKNYPRVEDGDKNKILTLLKKLVNQELEVRILDADRATEKLIVSEKATQREKDMETISGLKVGDVIEGEVSGVVDFGAFIKFFPSGLDAEKKTEEEQLEGLVHISEMAWQLIENPRDIVKTGSKVKAKIIGIEGDKISLSIRALENDPWSVMPYRVGEIVQGRVHRINPFGAFIYLDKDIHGLAHISEMSEAFPGKKLDELIKVGEAYDWKILSIEPAEHRMGLLLSDKKIKPSKEKPDEKEKPVADEKEKVEEKEEKPKN